MCPEVRSVIDSFPWFDWSSVDDRCACLVEVVLNLRADEELLLLVLHALHLRRASSVAAAHEAVGGGVAMEPAAAAIHVHASSFNNKLS